MTHDITSHAQTKTQPLTFDDFYRQQAEPLGRALALSLNNPELAEDALNEAMARALQRWKRVSDFDNPAGWVYRVAMNWALSWLRRRRRERERPIVFGSPITEIEPVDHELANALAALSLEHRAVHRVQGNRRRAGCRTGRIRVWARGGARGSERAALWRHDVLTTGSRTPRSCAARRSESIRHPRYPTIHSRTRRPQVEQERVARLSRCRRRLVHRPR